MIIILPDSASYFSTAFFRSYWEIDKVSSGNQYFMGRNPSSNFSSDEHGWNQAIICETHMTRRSRLSIEQTNTGYEKDLY